jgi:EAL domain-containing protein (putative c-di-GMP-specific phosphodiesterase class I)
MEKYYNVTIKWLDDYSIVDLTFKEGDSGEDDEDVFYYIDGVHELEELKVVGVEDFVVLRYEEQPAGTLSKVKFLAELEFQDEISEDQIETIQQNIMDALVSWVDSGPGLAPDENLTRSINVVDSDGRGNLHLFKIS